LLLAAAADVILSKMALSQCAVGSSC